MLFQPVDALPSNDESEFDVFFTESGLQQMSYLEFSAPPEFLQEEVSIVFPTVEGIENISYTRTSYVSSEETGSYSFWIGESPTGEIRIASEDGAVACHIKNNNDEYTAVQGLGSKGFLYRIPTTNYDSCGTDDIDAVELPPDGVMCDFDPCLSLAKILILHRHLFNPLLLIPNVDDNPRNFLPFALMQARKLQVLSTLSVNQDVLDNNGIPIRLSYDFIYVDAPDETRGSRNFLTELPDYMPIYSNLRDNHSAEFVQLIIDDRTWGIAGSAFISSTAIASPDNDIHYFSYAHLWASSSTRYTSIHEIGHLLGATHNPISNGGTGDRGVLCAGGWRFRPNISELSRTVMATARLDGERVPYFSNPEIQAQGRRYGTDDDNNSKILEKNSCILNVQPFVNDWDISFVNPLPWCIDLSNPSDPNRYIEVDVIEPNPLYLLPGNPPYSVKWTSVGGVHIGPVFDAAVHLPNIPSQVFTINIEVTSSDGEILERSFSVHNLENCIPLSDNLMFEIDAVEYYDLLGRRVEFSQGQSLEPGVYIEYTLGAEVGKLIFVTNQ
jgi:hypothetical protein